jgi:hypothetical protein
MLGHEDIPVDDEAVLATRFFQDLQEKVAALDGAQLRLAAIATAGNEMQVLSAIIAMETFGHPDRVAVRTRM